MSAEIPSIDPRALRDAFGCFMTGVTVVTTLDAAGAPQGFTANSFSSVSLDPPLLLVSLANSSRNLDSFAKGAGFAVNILAEGQKDISATFARPSEDRFASVYWRKGPVGNPLIAGVSAWFDCTLEQAIAAGDHTILIGRVGGFEGEVRADRGAECADAVLDVRGAWAFGCGYRVDDIGCVHPPGAFLGVHQRAQGLALPEGRDPEHEMPAGLEQGQSPGNQREREAARERRDLIAPPQQRGGVQGQLEPQQVGRPLVRDGDLGARQELERRGGLTPEQPVQGQRDRKPATGRGRDRARGR